jgi:pimeloyl-ACP methyl ester carboxylesterase
MVGPVERWRGRSRGLDEGMELDGRGAETVRGRGSQERLPSGRECAIPEGIHLSPYRGAADWPWTFNVPYLQSSPRFVFESHRIDAIPDRKSRGQFTGRDPSRLPHPIRNERAGSGSIFYNGFDVTKELLYAFIRNEFVNRGIACLVIDTPGTGEPLRLRNVPSRPDYEVPTAAIVDYLETRADIDSDRIGIVGISLEGYHAPRSAAFEPRIKACVAWGAIWDYGAAWQRRWETLTKKTSVPFWQLPWVMCTDTMEEALDRVRPFSLAGVLSNLKQPFLVVHGDKDAMIPIEDGQKVVDKAGSLDKQLKIFTAADGGCDHVGADNPDPVRQLIVDWFAQRLGTVARA